MKENTTTNHEEIKQWAQEHDAIPAVVKSNDESTSILRFKIQSESDDLEEINWEHFFELFEANKLALIHSADSNFNKFVSRD